MSTLALEEAPKLYNFQSAASNELAERIVDKYLPAVLLIGGTGIGKTYILGSLIKGFYDTGFFDRFPVTFNRALYVTKASIVEQTVRVLRDFPLFKLRASSIAQGQQVFVTNYDQLRASLGDMMIEDYTVVERGEAVIKYKWKENITPILIIWDECHALMREGSQQSKIAQAINDLPPERRKNVVQIFTSATPFGRPCEMKCFAVATRIKYRYGFVESPLTNEHWRDFSDTVAGPDKYFEHSPSAVARMMDVLGPYIVFVKNVRPKYHAINSTRLISFSTQREREVYDAAFEEYQEFLRNRGRNELEGMAAVLVAILKFQQAAEVIRGPTLAKLMHQAYEDGYAPVCAVKFRATVAKIKECLVNDYGYDKDDVSLIWGGVSDVSELKDEYQDLDLGPQNRKARQLAIDRFQEGKAKFCIYTFKSGGVGLSLHHDRPHTRPRKVFIAPTYNAKELVQGVGRCARLTSLSDTVQEIIYYANTIEEEVAGRVAIKLRCLKEVVKQREDWTDMLNVKVRSVKIDNLELLAPEKPLQLNDINPDDEDDSVDSAYIEPDEGDEIDI